jgi:hypothetical protein
VPIQALPATDIYRGLVSVDHSEPAFPLPSSAMPSPIGVLLQTVFYVGSRSFLGTAADC